MTKRNITFYYVRNITIRLPKKGGPTRVVKGYSPSPGKAEPQSKAFCRRFAKEHNLQAIFIESKP
tara:strand:- start:591 stop:785 length:195 start_codon:yes stop_codon:yes gene_type:complete